MNWVEKYNIDLSEFDGIDEDTFNMEVEYWITHTCDMVPYDAPDYNGEVERIAVETASAFLKATPELIEEYRKGSYLDNYNFSEQIINEDLPF